MIETDFLIHIRLFCVGRVRFGRAIHNFRDTRKGNARLAHIGNYTPQLTNRPNQNGIIGHKRDKLAGRHGALYTEQAAEHNDQHYLQTRNKIADTPKRSHVNRHTCPEAGIFDILLFKPLAFIRFAAKRAHNPHTGEVFLRDGGKNAFVFIAFTEMMRNPAIEIHRVKNNHRKSGGGNQREPRAHREHEPQRRNQQNHNTEHSQKLFRKEVAHNIHVRSAALDNIARFVLHMPGKRQALNMPKQQIAHGLHQRFRCPCVEIRVQETAKRAYGCQR